MPTENPQIIIDRIDLAEGWVCFQAGEHPPEPDELPLYLNHAFTTWLRRNSDFQDSGCAAHRREGEHDCDPRLVRVTGGICRATGAVL